MKMILLRLFDHPDPLTHNQIPGKDLRRLFGHQITRMWWAVNLSVLDMKRQTSQHCNQTDWLTYMCFEIEGKSRTDLDVCGCDQ